MTRPKRINPHQRGTGEHVLFNSFRRHQLDAKRLQAEADGYQAKANAARAAAASYAAALTALGHPPEGAALLIEGPKQ